MERIEFLKADNCYADAGTSCDDGLFCNGEDLCNGNGVCIHSGNPCASEPQICQQQCNETSRLCVTDAGVSCADSLFCNGENEKISSLCPDKQF